MARFRSRRRRAVSCSTKVIKSKQITTGLVMKFAWNDGDARRCHCAGS